MEPSYIGEKDELFRVGCALSNETGAPDLSDNTDSVHDPIDEEEGPSIYGTQGCYRIDAAGSRT